MQIKIHVVINVGDGDPDVLDVADLQRGPLRPESLGLMLAEGRAILAGIEQAMVSR